MSVKEIEQAIEKLSEVELEQLRKWFDELEATQWDEQFEADVEAGKLDELANKALTDFEAGKFKEL